jgi:dienelactone hydrolase
MKAGYLVIALLAAFTVAGLGCQDGSNTVAGANKAAAAESTPAKNPVTGTQTAKIDSPDKAVIVGTFYEAEKANSPAVLLLHQWQSDRHSYDDFARRMQAKGFAVLSIDGRGFGESTKTSDGRTISPERTDAAVKAMLGDVGAAFDFLAKQKNVDSTKIGIIGASYGSSLALIYATGNPKVAATALLSPGLNYFGSLATEPAVKNYGDRPLLLVAAEDDGESADAVRKLTAAGNNAKYVQKIYPSGGHGTGIFKANVGLEDTLGSFLLEKLGPLNK